MHKKDRVKEVIEKYIGKGKDFFELTPSYLMTLEELKGFSERTLKRGRTEYKNEHIDLLEGKSKAGLNLKRKVFNFLDQNPGAPLEKLKKKFSSQNEKQIEELFSAWETNQGSGKEGKPIKSPKGNEAGSLRQMVFAHLDKNPDLTLSKLERIFEDDNKKTISNYLDQWRKERSSNRKKPTTKQRIIDYLSSHPEATLKRLKKVFPDVNPSSIAAYHSFWKSSQKAHNGISSQNADMRKSRTIAADAEALSANSAQQIIEALNSTVEAQKKAIEALKSQNAMLQDIRGFSFPELKGMNKKDIDKFERVMATFLKGLRG